MIDNFSLKNRQVPSSKNKRTNDDQELRETLNKIGQSQPEICNNCEREEATILCEECREKKNETIVKPKSPGKHCKNCDEVLHKKRSMRSHKRVLIRETAETDSSSSGTPSPIEHEKLPVAHEKISSGFSDEFPYRLPSSCDESLKRFKQSSATCLTDIFATLCGFHPIMEYYNYDPIPDGR